MIQECSQIVTQPTLTLVAHYKVRHTTQSADTRNKEPKNCSLEIKWVAGVRFDFASRRSSARGMIMWSMSGSIKNISRRTWCSWPSCLMTLVTNWSQPPVRTCSAAMSISTSSLVEVTSVLWSARCRTITVLTSSVMVKNNWWYLKVELINIYLAKIRKKKNLPLGIEIII